MTDLAAWLLACIAEDERWAKNATQGRWKLWGMDVLADQDGTSNVDTAIPVADVHSPPGEFLRTWNAEHIARWDPARVLAECESKRQIVELHTPVNISLSSTVVMHCQADGTRHADLPCETLRLLAQPFAGRPGWREEWRLA